MENKKKCKRNGEESVENTLSLSPSRSPSFLSHESLSLVELKALLRHFERTRQKDLKTCVVNHSTHSDKKALFMKKKKLHIPYE